MENTVITLIIASILAFTFGTLPYLIATLKGTVQPNKITWILWSVPLIAVMAQYQSNSLTWASLPVFIGGFGPLLILFASFLNKKAKWELKTFDYICGSLGLFTLIFYLITNNAIVSITLAVLTDAFGAIPTIKKAYTNPESELISPYTVFMIFAILSFFTMQRFDYIEMVFPLYFIILDLIMIYLLRKQLFKLFSKKNKKTAKK